MTSFRASGRLVITILLAALVALAAPTPALAERAAPPSVTVDPGKLKTGAQPNVPWLDVARGRIVQPNGGRTIAGKRFGPSDLLLHARNGYLLTLRENDRRNRVLFVGYTGATRVVVRSTKLYPSVVSADGRWLVMDSNPFDSDRKRKTLQVVRISDGRVVGTRSFPRYSEPLVAGSGRVLIRQNVPKERTLWWNPTTDAVRVAEDRPASAASLGARLVAVDAGRGSAVVDLRTQRQLWRTPASKRFERVLSFSPDDKRLVTSTGRRGEYTEDALWPLTHRLWVRDARTGRLLAAFKGNFAMDDYRTGFSPVWESNTSLLLHATSDRFLADPESEFTYPNASVIRCSTVTATCVKVPISNFDVLVTRKSN